MNDFETVINKIHIGECPFCHNEQFIVSEIVETEYLTNKDGEVIDSIESKYDSVGICLKCNHTYPMKPVFDGFIPMTPLRQFMDKYIDYDKDVEMVKEVDNPMQRRDIN